MNAVVRTVLRKSWHLLGLIFPAAYYLGVVTKTSVLIILAVFLVVGGALEVTRFRYRSVANLFNRVCGPLMRDAERRTLNATLPYILGVLLVILFFPKATALAATACLAFGDAAAEFVGKYLGRITVARGKTLEGALACFAACFLITWYFFSWPVALAAAAAATLTEVLSRGWADNLAMPLAAAVAMRLVSHFAHIPLS